MSKRIVWLARLTAGALMSLVLWWAGSRFLGVGSGGPFGAFLTVAWMALIGLGWFLILGWPLLQSLGQKAGGLFWPSDRGLEVRPQHSIAEARFHQGRYDEAITAFREDIARFPDEVYPHMRIADIELEKRDRPDAAIAEMQTALTKARTADGFSLIAHRLADLLLRYRQDRDGARAVLEQIALRYPHSRQARAAAERVARLRDGTGGGAAAG